MTGVTYNTNVTTGITLTNPNTQNPATIAAGVTITNTGTTNNGDAIYGASGPTWTVVNLGTVSAAAAAGVGVALGNGGLIANGTLGGATAVISSNYIGVKIATSFGTVANYSTIASTGAAGNDAAVYLANGGLVNNGPAALIAAVQVAVLTANTFSTVTNAGAIQNTNASGSAANAAVVLGAGGMLANAGVISATGVGVAGAGGIAVAVESQSGGNVTNAFGATVQGYQNGIDFVGGFGTVANFGTVRNTSSGNFAGIYMNTGGLIVNGAANDTAALIAGPTRAIQFNNTTPPGQSVGTVVNFGTIASAPAGTVGAGIEFDFGGLVNNASGALISSTRSAVLFNTFSGTLSNLGTIADSGTGAAVYVGASGNITNGSTAGGSALITSAATGISARNAAANITNFGTIVSTATSFPGAGVYMSGGGSLINAAGALITAKQSAFSVFTNTTNLTNDGTVVSTGATAPGVYLGHGGTITNGAAVSSALISGNGGGIFVKNGFGLVDNLGTVANGGAGVGAAAYLSDGGAVVNGSAAAPAALIASTGGGILTAHVFATVSNFGTVASTSQGTAGIGVYLFGAGGIIINQAGGLISTYKTAVEATSFGGTNVSGTLGNSGLIENSGTAPTLYFTTFAAITNAANATIENTSSGAAIGLNTTGTVVNNGVVASAAGAAVSIGGGPAGDTAIITLDNNSTITGKSGVIVSATDHGFNTLVNNGTVTGTGGTAFAFGGGDDTLVIDPGSVLNGAIANFHPGSRIDFANQVGTGVTFSNGVLTLVNGNAVVNSVTLSGAFYQAQFAVASDMNGGTNVTLNAPGMLFAPAQLGSSTFGVSLTAGGWTSQNLNPRELADVNGDGKADIVGFGSNGAYVALAAGNGYFGAPILGIPNFGSSPAGGGWTSDNVYPREMARVNADKMADIVGFGANGVYVSLATGGGNFAAPTSAINAFGAAPGAGGWNNQNNYPREMADVSGNGLADIVAFGANGVYVSDNLGNGHFAQPTLALNAFGAAQGWTTQDQFPRELADLTGNGLADIVGFGSNGVWVAMNLGNGQFAQPTLALGAFGAAGGWTSQTLDPRELADINGDGMADIVGFGSNGVWVSQATGNGTFAQPVFGFNEFGSSAQGGGWTSNGVFPRELADVNGDKKADIVGFGNAGAYVALSLAPTPGGGGPLPT